jgi:hypothetical protein
MKKLSDKIVDAIIEQKVKPRPRWTYVASKWLYWFFAVLAVFFGALAFGLAIFLLRSIDWNVYTLLGYTSLHSFVMSAFPYAFLVVFILALALAYSAYRRTPRGYRLNFPDLTVILVIAAGSLGFLLHILGSNETIYLDLARMPGYQKLVFTKEAEWLNPQKGLLWGEALSAGPDSFQLKDMNQKTWTVNFDRSTAWQSGLDNKNITGDNLKITGQLENGGRFRAATVAPWDGIMNCGGGRNSMMDSQENYSPSSMMNGRGGSGAHPAVSQKPSGGSCGLNPAASSCVVNNE